jgi:hypothetical protein
MNRALSNAIRICAFDFSSWVALVSFITTRGRKRRLPWSGL